MFERVVTVFCPAATTLATPFEINGPGGDPPLEVVAWSASPLGAPSLSQVVLFEGDKDAATAALALAGGIVDCIASVPPAGDMEAVSIPGDTNRITIFIAAPAATATLVTVVVRSARHR